MGNVRQEKTSSITLLNYVSRALTVGPKTKGTPSKHHTDSTPTEREFAKKIGDLYGVKISIANTGAATVFIKGGDRSTREQVKNLIKLLDYEASQYAKNNNLRGIDDIRSSHFDHMRLTFEDVLSVAKADVQKAVEKQKPDAAALQRVAANANGTPEKTIKSAPVKPAESFTSASNADTPEIEPSQFFEDPNSYYHPAGAFKNAAKQGPKSAKSNASERNKGRRIEIKAPYAPRNQSQAIGYLAIKDPNVSVVFLVGAGGGGKSRVGIQGSIELHNEGVGDGEAVMFLRPRTVTGKEKFGAVGGDEDDKMAPYTAVLDTNIVPITGKSMKKQEDVIRAGTPDFLRGATFSGIVMIDEAQNLSVNEATMIITRIGWGGKTIITGDISNNQTDTGEYPGLAHLIATLTNGITGGDVKLKQGLAFVSFTEDDSAARHPLLPNIQKALNNPDEEYKALMAKIGSTKRDFAEVTAIKDATKLARERLEIAAKFTTERYLEKAQQMFPRLWGTKPADNVHHLPVSKANLG